MGQCGGFHSSCPSRQLIELNVLNTRPLLQATDGVLFFDDSFEHRVWNECDAERVVFQVVFVHPEVRLPPPTAA